MKTNLTILLFFFLSIAKSQTNITVTPSQGKFYNSAVTGITGDFRTLGLGNSSHTLTSSTDGTGKAAFFSVTNTSNSNDVLAALTFGTGRAGYFQISNVSNNSAAIYGETNGTGAAGFFNISNILSGNAAIYCGTNGTGPSIWSRTTGTGRAARFEISNAANSSDVINVTTNGTGTAGYFSSTSGNALITGTGNVGIGISPNLNPGEIININGRLRVKHTLTNTAGIWFNDVNNSLNFDAGSFFGMETATPGSERSGIWIANAWRFYIDRVGTAKFTGAIDADGYSYFRSGVELCGGNLRVHGDILASGSVLSSQGLFPCPSDQRFKKDINTLPNALSKVLQMRGVSYFWKQEDFKERNFSSTKQMGFIAQELEQIIPDVILTMEDGYKAVDYSKITALLTEAIKDQQKIIDELRNKNQKLESRLDKIEAMLQK